MIELKAHKSEHGCLRVLYNDRLRSQCSSAAMFTVHVAVYVDRMRPIAVVRRAAAAHGVAFTPPLCLHTLISALHFVISQCSL